MGERRVKTKADSSVSFDEDQAFGLGDSFDLMRHRVGEILLVSSLYDSYTLEEDGQLGDRILADYVDLHLRYTPRVTRVSTARKALNLLGNRRFDLVITMMRLPDMDVQAFCREVKKRYLGTPLVVLVNDSLELPVIMTDFDRSLADQLLVWSGDSRLLLSAIKLIEDRINVDHDTREGGVRVLLFVEDSARRTSSFLPMVYAELMTQTRNVMAEGLNYMDKLLRMRARPKILLARNYEDALRLSSQVGDYLMAVISDVRFPQRGKLRDDAGFELLELLRSRYPRLPVILHSSNPGNEERAAKMGLQFLDKNSQTWLQDLQEFFVTHLGFGDFIFRMSDGTEIDRARRLRDMEKKVLSVPDESLRYHLKRHHLSIWLTARGEYTLAKSLADRELDQFQDLQDARDFVAGMLQELRQARHRGVISDFVRADLDAATPFMRLGGGSLGGKGRGIAFQAALLAKLDLDSQFDGVRISVPQTLSLGTDLFVRFLDENHLEKLALRSTDDGEIAEAFLEGHFGDELIEDLRAYLAQVHYPLAVRSSSLLEDSLFQPFAGLYRTYMVPNNDEHLEIRLRQLTNAIKLVYASTFYQAPRSYIRSTSFRIEEEQMGVIVQRMVATRHQDLCYPNFAGVAQSHNFYPLGRLKAEDGLVQVALGLGKTVVDGGNVLRFSPARPKVLPQFSSIRDVLKNSQTEFYALDLSQHGVVLSLTEEGPLVKKGLKRAEKDGTLVPVGSVYSAKDGVIRDGIYHKGPRLVTFANVLKYDQFPLAGILRELLRISRAALAMDVEMEFAVNLVPPEVGPHEFAIVQCRPLATTGEHAAVDLRDEDRDRAICWTEQCLGTGKMTDVADVVYVSPERWDNTRTAEIAREVGEINALMEKEKRHFILMGMGRWGTADHFLGIPVTWNEISQSRVMVEVGTSQYQVEPSQGSHFFHNITSFHIGYMTIQEGRYNSFVDWETLESAEVVRELDFVRHVRFAEPLEVRLDGRRGCGAILLPSHEEEFSLV